MIETEFKRIQTPWGLSDDNGFEIAEGIIVHSTASHGGIYLSPKRVAEFEAIFPGFERYTGDPEWFEEDCDAAVIPLAFPQYFSAKDIRTAGLMVQSMTARRFEVIKERLKNEKATATGNGNTDSSRAGRG